MHRLKIHDFSHQKKASFRGRNHTQYPRQIGLLNSLEKAVLAGDEAITQIHLERGTSFRLSPYFDGTLPGLWQWKIFQFCFYLTEQSQQRCLVKVMQAHSQLLEQCLLLATLYNDSHTLHALLQRSCERHCTDLCGNTPLHLASYKGHVEAVDLLLAYGANTMIHNEDGLTPLDIAIKKNRHSKIISLLLESGAEPTQFSIKCCIEHKLHTLLIRLIKQDLTLLPYGMNEACRINQPQSLLLLVNCFHANTKFYRELKQALYLEKATKCLHILESKISTIN